MLFFGRLDEELDEEAERKVEAKRTAEVERKAEAERLAKEWGPRLVSILSRRQLPPLALILFPICLPRGGSMILRCT